MCVLCSLPAPLDQWCWHCDSAGVTAHSITPYRIKATHLRGCCWRRASQPCVSHVYMLVCVLPMRVVLYRPRLACLPNFIVVYLGSSLPPASVVLSLVQFNDTSHTNCSIRSLLCFLLVLQLLWFVCTVAAPGSPKMSRLCSVTGKAQFASGAYTTIKNVACL